MHVRELSERAERASLEMVLNTGVGLMVVRIKMSDSDRLTPNTSRRGRKLKRSGTGECTIPVRGERYCTPKKIRLSTDDNKIQIAGMQVKTTNNILRLKKKLYHISKPHYKYVVDPKQKCTIVSIIATEYHRLRVVATGRPLALGFLCSSGGGGGGGGGGSMISTSSSESSSSSVPSSSSKV